MGFWGGWLVAERLEDRSRDMCSLLWLGRGNEMIWPRSKGKRSVVVARLSDDSAHLSVTTTRKR